MTKKERFDDMEKALRGHCPDEDLLDEISFNLYAVNMVYHNYGNIEQALTEFVEKVKRKIIKGDGDEQESDFTRGYNCACDSHTEAIEQTLQEFLNSLNNQNQGE